MVLLKKLKKYRKKKKKIRSRIKKLDRIEIEDRIYRSRAILLSARTLKYKELIKYSLWLRVGLDYGILEDLELDTLYYIIAAGRSGHLKQLYQKSNYYKNIDEMRANVIRDILKNK